MNASDRLNTCKSRGSRVFGPLATGARVRNTCATYLKLGHNPEKFGLIPHNIFEWHHLIIKDLLVLDGHAQH